jgi:predicted transcriptional regulator
MSFPQWTEEISRITVAGEDHLGVEGPAQAFQQEFLPGIITVTDHARYYSYYAWILYRFIRLPDSTRASKDFQGSFFKRHEVALLLSAFLHHGEGRWFGGVIGVGNSYYKARKYWGNSLETSLDHDYFKNPEGGFGQYYRNAMLRMGIIEEPENEKWVYRLTDRGLALAEAYEKSIEDTGYYRELTAKKELTQINRITALEYAEKGCICPAAISNGADRNQLLDAFFRFEQSPEFVNPHYRRRNALGVALDLVKQHNNRFRVEMIKPALYIGEYEIDITYKPTPALAEWVDRWRMVEVRHYLTFGLQCLWASFLLDLKNEFSLSTMELSEGIKDRLDSYGWNMPFRDLALTLYAEAGISANYEDLVKGMPAGFLLSSGLDEYTLASQAMKHSSDADFLFKSGVRILIQFFVRNFSTYIQQGEIWNSMANRDRLPLNEFFSQVSKNYLREDWSAHDFLDWIYSEYIIAQHEMIGLEKLRYQGYDTFKFYTEDNVYRLPSGKKEYQEPIGLSSNRLSNCISMLIDLGLILESDDKTLSLSVEGEEYHRRVLKGLRP